MAERELFKPVVALGIEKALSAFRLVGTCLFILAFYLVLHPIAAATASPAAGAPEDAAVWRAEVGRTAAVCALELQQARCAVVDELGAPKDEVAARLAREGGRFGDLTITLVWNDEADLDLWVVIPSGEKIYYSNKKSKDGLCELDIDMNANMLKSKEPVENVYVGDAEVDGRYREI